MRVGNSRARSWIAIAVALVFAIAAMPGSMAMPGRAPMPAPVSHAAHAMLMSGGSMTDCSGHEQTPCDHMKTQKHQGTPCKNAGACMGMLSCFAMGAFDTVAATPPVLLQDNAVAVSHQTVSGLTPSPDNPPPIA
jgi:hypothetical protein